ncbi:MAG: XRE family transcriptional regulator [Microbacteriaceae bacterium]|nr:XRE family transcriptional regulator [Microbacteriaceae bacterium]
MTQKFMSRAEVAEYIGVQPGTLDRYKLPEPDAIIGRARGWLTGTIDKWNDERPGRGNWRKPVDGSE